MNTKEELNFLKEEEEPVQVTRGTKDPRYICLICEELFSSRTALKDHERFIHRIGFPE